MSSRISLGTAQFGMPYGIANQAGQVSCEQASRILNVAKEAGIKTLDTAIAYGDSEQVLGGLGIDGWQAITKISAVPDECLDIPGWIRTEIAASLNRLGVKQIKGLLLHRPLQLLDPIGVKIFDTLEALKSEGIVEKTGFSVYSPTDLDLLWSAYQPDIVQVPFNVLDRRMLLTGWLDRMRGAGVEVHTRSAFLQGLLLMNETNRPAKFNKWSNLWSDWSEWLRQHDLRPLEACLSFALSRPEIDRVVVGVDNIGHLDEIIEAAQIVTESPPLSISSKDENLIDPSKWTVA